MNPENIVMTMFEIREYVSPAVMPAVLSEIFACFYRAALED
jgi:hypothetical protein